MEFDPNQRKKKILVQVHRGGPVKRASSNEKAERSLQQSWGGFGVDPGLKKEEWRSCTMGPWGGPVR